MSQVMSQATPKIHLIGFATQGPPYDEGKDISKTSAFVKYSDVYKKAVDFFTLYTTETATQMYPEFKEYIQSYPQYDYGEHSRGCNHGFWKWKPFLILKYLEKMEEGDILMYQDTDTTKYKEYVIDVGNLRSNIRDIFSRNQNCVIAQLENPFEPNLINQNYTNPGVFQALRSNEECIKAPIMRCSRIFIQKNKLSMNFVKNWLSLCETSLIFPDPNFPQNKEIRSWHTHDQALFNVLYQKYIELKLFRKPNLYFKNHIFSKEMIQLADRPVKMVPVKIRRPALKFI